MKPAYTWLALIGLLGPGLILRAQRSPAFAKAPGSQDQAAPATEQPQTPVDAHSQQSARSFEGKIMKSGDKLVLQESATQTNYQLDDQHKAKQYQGREVKVMATVDMRTNVLHVVDISPASK